ncbi:HlyD family type I secretion membrane fusion protein [Pseudomonas fluvialis]|uniref:Membrane fusion protein (MFP) family protein n=1 Tax=Pseudomonas fluvialis TaxID=1793966 RepID=A0A7X0BTI2_9PSED|nr:HlyD family type I secretion periplasmic adaptor subunit [Pseudomonas fluvialis]MBB6342594.1 HlyD family type I secretion membrane fusion protein [Pseudomonas fluvialis]
MNTQKNLSIAAIVTQDERSAKRIETLLDQGNQTRTMRRTLLGIIALVIVFIVWASITPVDELAKARGEIQPSEHVQTLQSEEGGRIVKLLVNEGDTVSEGQPLVEFAATNLAKDRGQVEIKLNALALDRERLGAILENRQPDFSAYAKDYPLLTAQAKVNYQAQMSMAKSALAARQSEVLRQEALWHGAVREEQQANQEVAQVQDRLSRIEEGAKRGLVSKITLSDARVQLSSARQRQAEIASRKLSTSSAIESAKAELAKQDAEFKQQISAELSKATEEYRETVSLKKSLEERQGFMLFKAPIAGVVTELPQTQVGAVIPPGGMIAQIVPSNRPVVMEAMVMPKDIGFVKPGQRAMVKIDSFDSARFGSIEGTVSRVAPASSKLKENGMPYYKVQITLAQPYVKSPEHVVITGMTGETDIATGQKTVMQFLLKPLFLASDTAFHER